MSYTVFTGVDRVIGIDGSGGLWIGDNCNGIALFGLFSGFIIAFPGKWWKKIIYIPIGIVLIEFVNVISHVYFNGNNHQSIAIEKIKYFYESLRVKFNINTYHINDFFINELCQLSGIEHSLLKQLFAYCEKIKSLNEISEYDLIELNRQISNFNKNSLR